MPKPELILPVASEAEFFHDPELDPAWYPGEGDILRKFTFSNGDIVTTLHHKDSDEIAAYDNGLEYFTDTGDVIYPPRGEAWISSLLVDAFPVDYLRFIVKVDGELRRSSNG